MAKWIINTKLLRINLTVKHAVFHTENTIFILNLQNSI